MDESGDILVLGSQGTQQITENTFPISHHPDWQIDLVHRWGPRLRMRILALFRTRT